MLTNILLLVTAIVVVVLLVAAFRPAQFTVVRRAQVAAPASVVFPYVDSLGEWVAWSPWEKIDPAMKRTFKGPSAGVGSAYGWEGNKNVGSGRMTITESRPGERIRIKLEFFAPMPGICDVEFGFAERDGKTDVTWTMSGTHTFMARLFCLFVSMERMVGDKHAQGLLDLKRLAEARVGASA